MSADESSITSKVCRGGGGGARVVCSGGEVARRERKQRE